MNNKGFIATSVLYSFFIIFLTLFLGIIADYLQDKVLLNSIEKNIKDEINSFYTDFKNSDIIIVYEDNMPIEYSFSNYEADTLYLLDEDSNLIEIELDKIYYIKKTKSDDDHNEYELYYINNDEDEGELPDEE